jgi:urease accessory protein
VRDSIEGTMMRRSPPSQRRKSGVKSARPLWAIASFGMQISNDPLTRREDIIMRNPLARAVTAAVLLIPTAAFAHTGHGDGHGLVHGIAHPLGGLDHILAMVTVGLFAWQLGGRALWLVPASFVLMMVAGGAAGMAGMPVPLVEFGIAASVIVLGTIVAVGIKTPVAVAMGLVGAFAIFHGYAHGAEMPVDASGLTYAAGFVLATALLHAGGIALGVAIGRLSDAYGRVGYQVSGGVVAVIGAFILAQAI